MSYSYQGYDYPQQQMQQMQQMPMYYGEPSMQRRNSGSGVVGTMVGGGVVGAATGGVIGAIQNPYFNKKGEATDMFVKKVFNNTIKKASTETQMLYKQRYDIINKIGNVKNADELKKLLMGNKEFLKSAVDINADDFIESITDETCKKVKDLLKETAENDINLSKMLIKTNIESCWDQGSKDLYKAAGISDSTFKNIQDSMSGLRWKNAGQKAFKGLAIGCAAALVITGIFKLVQNRKQKA